MEYFKKQQSVVTTLSAINFKFNPDYFDSLYLIAMYFCNDTFPVFKAPPLHDFFQSNKNIEKLRKLLRSGKNPNSRDGFNRTPLHVAILKCERNRQKTDEILQGVNELIKGGANVNLEDGRGVTPLHIAVMCRNLKVIETLLKANADINAKDPSLWTALHFATTRCSFQRYCGAVTFYKTELDVVKLLLRNDAIVDTQNCTDETPLMFAVQDNNYPIIRALLKKNASVNLHDPFGYSALHYAMDSEKLNARIVFLLTRYEGSFNLSNIYNRTPVVTYLDKLRSNPTCTEMEKAKHVIKLFILKYYEFDNEEISCINLLHKANKDCNLVRFLRLCHMEVVKMVGTVLVPSWTVFRVAFRLTFFSNWENENHIPYVVLDKTINKLLRLDFPVYSDMIASGICRPYMYCKLAEICCNNETSISVFEFAVIHSISKYLTNLEMLFLMFACLKERPSMCLSRFRRFSRCSIA